MKLTQLNNLGPVAAQNEFVRCCGSSRWANLMAARLPFRDEHELFAAAQEIWRRLSPEDWLEAFSHHPKIGDRDSLRQRFNSTRQWSAGEQAGMHGAAEQVLEALAAGNADYEEKFGYIFIVCATGKSAEEMLASLRQRFPNDPAVEIQIAAEEQSKITQIRLEKLLKGPTLMRTSLTQETTSRVFARLQEANNVFAKIYPGESAARQPVHTVYGGAQLFKADAAPKLGAVALRTLQEYAPNFVALAKALGLRGADQLPETETQILALQQKLTNEAELARRDHAPAWLAHTVYTRVLEKLQREPVEDLRIDFEDGYGNRLDTEEDGHAAAAAEEVARGMREGSLPPFIGIRIKPFTEELKTRSIRTLDIFISTLAERTGGKLPPHFVVTLPKVTMAQHVTALVQVFEALEARIGLAAGALQLEIMVETTQAIINLEGYCSLPAFVAAANGRCVSAHFGVYDYTAASNITAPYQSMDHASCDFARHMMTVALAGTGLWMSDGATNVMPIGPHRTQAQGPALSAEQKRENQRAVHDAWRLGYHHIQHSLRHGFYQGWDLHPSQLPVRYAAVYNFFLEGLETASQRLKSFIEKAAQATLLGAVFDDAATGQGLLNFFLRGINCGAITEQEALVTGLTLEEIRGKSFVKILQARRGLEGR